MEEQPVPRVIRMAAQAARVLGLEYTNIDTETHYLARVSDGSKHVYVGAGHIPAYPINQAVQSAIAKDKMHTVTVLKQANIATPASFLVFFHQERNFDPVGHEVADGAAFARRIGYPVFVKPNNGTGGDYAELIHDEPSLHRHLVQIQKDYRTAIIQSYIEGLNYRVIVLDHVPKFAYRKNAPVLVGDGVSSVREILTVHNAALAACGATPTREDNPVLLAAMAELRLSYTDPLPLGSLLSTTARVNISAGATASHPRTVFSPAETAFLARCSHAIDLRICGIDLIVPPGSSSLADGVVIEINASPGMTGLEQLGYADLKLTLWCDVLTKALADKASA